MLGIDAMADDSQLTGQRHALTADAEADSVLRGESLSRIESIQSRNGYCEELRHKPVAVIVALGGHMRVENAFAFLLSMAFCLAGCSREGENQMVSDAVVGKDRQFGGLSRDEARDIACRAARAEGHDVAKSAKPKIAFDPDTQQWSLYYEATDPASGNGLLVVVDARTGRASVRSEARGGTMPLEELQDTARRAARAEGYDPEKFAAPKITFDSEAQQWSLSFVGSVNPAPGNSFLVLVDDRTGKTSVRHGW